MYKKILVPLDGSKLAEIALNYTSVIAAKLPGVEVDLLHVYNPQEAGLAPMHRGYIDQVADIVRRKQEEDAVLKVRGELIKGHPADEIVSYTERKNIDLVIMATHGRSGVSMWAMGSVAYKVLRLAKVPICLVRAGITEKMIYDKSQSDTILVPLDGSRLAESVLPHIEALVKQIGVEKAEVVLLRVCGPPVVLSGYPPVVSLGWEEHVAKEQVKCKLDARGYLAEIGKRLRNVGIKVRIRVITGQPPDEIVDYASKRPISLIVMATHGRSGISRLAYGSVAEKVMLGTFTPVMMVGQQ